MTLEEIKRGVIEEIHRAQDKFPWWPMDVVRIRVDEVPKKTKGGSR